MEKESGPLKEGFDTNWYFLTVVSAKVVEPSQELVTVHLKTTVPSLTTIPATKSVGFEIMTAELLEVQSPVPKEPGLIARTKV